MDAKFWLLAGLVLPLLYICNFAARLFLGLGEAGRPVGEAEKVANPLYRFVTPERLRRLTVTAGVLSGTFAAAMLLLLGAPLLAVAPVAAVLGFGASRLPLAWYKRRVRLRRALFDRRLMELTLGMSNGLRAGSSLTQTMEAVSRDLGGPIAEEFGHLLHEHRFGKDMAECLDNLARRMPSEELTLLTTSIRISLQTGGSLAEMMDRLSETIRFRIDFKERVKTMTTQGRFEAMAMGAAPFVIMVVLYFVNKDMMVPLFTTPTGWYGLAGVAVLETLGFFVINKIATIEV